MMIKNYTCLYTVTLGEWDDATKTTKTYQLCGTISCDSYAEAAAEVEKYYEHELMDMKLELFDISHLCFDPEHYDLIFKMLNEG